MSTTTTYTGVRIVDMPDLGTVTDNSSVVGEHAGSGRFGAQPLRSFVLHDGQMSNDWLSPLVGWPAYSSTAYVLSPDARMAVTGASNTANGASTTWPVAIGVSGFGFHNLVTTDTRYGAWGGYFEGRMYPGATSYAYGIEVQIANVTGTDAPFPSPYVGTPGPVTYALNIGSGADVHDDTPSLTAKAAAAAIWIGANGARFNQGIVFHAQGLTGTDGTGGAGGGAATAINLAAGHTIQWTQPSGAAGPAIFSEQASGTPVQLVFDANVAYFRDTTPALGVGVGALGGGNTALELRVSNNAGTNYVPVTLGAPDSGGAGFRVLRVPN